MKRKSRGEKKEQIALAEQSTFATGVQLGVWG